MSWIKVENATPHKPEVLTIARLLGVSRDDAFGKAMRFWMWLDTVTVDGRVDGVTSQDVDALVGADGVASALQRVGWVIIDDENQTISVPNFDRHNGESAKYRASKARRQAKWRKNRVDASVDTEASLDKRREDKKEDTNVSSHSAKRHRYTDEFERFWTTYPAGGRVAKPKAFAAWKIHAIDPASVIKAASEYAQCGKVRDGIIRHATTWLNGEAWNDDRSAWQSTNGHSTPIPRKSTLDEM